MYFTEKYTSLNIKISILTRNDLLGLNFSSHIFLLYRVQPFLLLSKFEIWHLTKTKFQQKQFTSHVFRFISAKEYVLQNIA
jgi:hypothetical protein